MALHKYIAGVKFSTLNFKLFFLHLAVYFIDDCDSDSDSDEGSFSVVLFLFCF